MRRRASWMNEKDDAILEYLAETESALPPAVIRWNLEQRGQKMSRKTIGRRLEKLRKAGLVKIDRQKGMYQSITRKGRDYLTGEIAVDEIESNS